MRAIELLRDEHELIGVALLFLEEIADRLESGEAMPNEATARVVTFFSGFADGCHHTKEEQALFPLLAAAGIPEEGGPLGIMLREHEKGRELVAELDALSASTETSSVARERFASVARTYVALLRDHIDKENNILFRMAERVLPDAEDDRLCAAFEIHERERLGPGGGSRFRSLVDEFKQALQSSRENSRPLLS